MSDNERGTVTARSGSAPPAALRAEGLEAGYNGHAVVREFNLTLHPGQVTTLLGPNGAGKTTTLLTLAGDVPPIAGTVSMYGRPVHSPMFKRAKNGLGFVTEERSVFTRLTVAQNLRVANADLAYALEVFPELRPLQRRQAGLLSGGQQQMLSLARALGRRPRILLVDELSLGLAPIVVQRLLVAIGAAAREGGLAVLLVEQHVRQAIAIADFVLVMQRGRIVLSGPAAQMESRLHEIEASYLQVKNP